MRNRNASMNAVVAKKSFIQVCRKNVIYAQKMFANVVAVFLIVVQNLFLTSYFFKAYASFVNVLGIITFGLHNTPFGK